MVWIQVARLDGVVVEYGEKAHEMAGVVDRGLVHQDEVLVYSAAAHAEARRSFAGSLNSGHHLYDLYDVGLSEQDRNLLDEVAGEIDETGLRTQQLLPFRYGSDGRAFQVQKGLLECEILLEIAFETDQYRIGIISQR